VLQTYLPSQLDAGQLTRRPSRRASLEAGAKSIKDLGAVMKLASAKLKGQAEGKAISEEVKAQLSKLADACSNGPVQVHRLGSFVVIPDEERCPVADPRAQDRRDPRARRHDRAGAAAWRRAQEIGAQLQGALPLPPGEVAQLLRLGRHPRFKCFGCQAGGDAISFVQRLLGKPFVDTVQDLAKELGIDLEAAVDPGMREKQQIKDATDFAAQHFQQRLWDPAIGHHAREYLRSRGLSDALMRAFGLGWAPLAWTELADKLREQGLLAFGEKAGLVSPRQRGDGFYDMFRGANHHPHPLARGPHHRLWRRLLEGDDGPEVPELEGVAALQQVRGALRDRPGARRDSQEEVGGAV
jgi:hypothetical protein